MDLNGVNPVATCIGKPPTFLYNRRFFFERNGRSSAFQLREEIEVYIQVKRARPLKENNYSFIDYLLPANALFLC